MATAAVGLVAVSVMTGAAQNWWGALADVPPVAGGGLVLGVSVVVAARVHKLPLALAFFGAFGATCTAATFVVAPDQLAEVFVAPVDPRIGEGFVLGVIGLVFARHDNEVAVTAALQRCKLHLGFRCLRLKCFFRPFQQSM